MPDRPAACGGFLAAAVRVVGCAAALVVLIFAVEFAWVNVVATIGINEQTKAVVGALAHILVVWRVVFWFFPGDSDA